MARTFSISTPDIKTALELAVYIEELMGKARRGAIPTTLVLMAATFATFQFIRNHYSFSGAKLAYMAGQIAGMLHKETNNEPPPIPDEVYANPGPHFERYSPHPLDHLGER